MADQPDDPRDDPRLAGRRRENGAPRRLCTIGHRVKIYNGSKPSIPGRIVGLGFHEMPGGKAGDTETGCIVHLDQPFDSPEGFYVRYLIVPPGGLEYVS